MRMLILNRFLGGLQSLTGRMAGGIAAAKGKRWKGDLYQRRLDVNEQKQGVFTMGACDVDGLVRLISDASSDPSVFRSVNEAAKQRAAEFTWGRFRSFIARELLTFQ